MRSTDIWDNGERDADAEPRPIILEAWVVRRKSDGFIIPIRGKDKWMTGGSHMEPMDPDAAGFMPKVFYHERVAKMWLTTWLKGKQERTYTYSLPDSDPDEWVKITPVASRNAADMEVKEVYFELPAKPTN